MNQHWALTVQDLNMTTIRQWEILHGCKWCNTGQESLKGKSHYTILPLFLWGLECKFSENLLLWNMSVVVFPLLQAECSRLSLEVCFVPWSVFRRVGCMKSWTTEQSKHINTTHRLQMFSMTAICTKQSGFGSILLMQHECEGLGCQAYSVLII